MCYRDRQSKEVGTGRRSVNGLISCADILSFAKSFHPKGLGDSELCLLPNNSVGDVMMKDVRLSQALSLSGMPTAIRGLFAVQDIKVNQSLA